MKFFVKGLRDKFKQGEQATEEICKTILADAPILAQMSQASKKGFRYVVDVTESMLDAIETGKIKLTTEKSRQMFAQIR